MVCKTMSALNTTYIGDGTDIKSILSLRENVENDIYDCIWFSEPWRKSFTDIMDCTIFAVSSGNDGVDILCQNEN